ncbi:hypothetical protein DNTS_024557 [Danionella cerebrum]|nr:hypothetical protein DNTS_024557 [Danionella translucida]
MNRDGDGESTVCPRRHSFFSSPGHELMLGVTRITLSERTLYDFTKETTFQSHLLRYDETSRSEASEELLLCSCGRFCPCALLLKKLYRPLGASYCSVWVRGLDTEGGFSLCTCVVQRWGTEEVAVWLEQLSLGEYKDTFIRHDIRGSELLHLERRDLKVYTHPLAVPQIKPNALSLSSYLSPCLLLFVLHCSAWLPVSRSELPRCCDACRFSEELIDAGKTKDLGISKVGHMKRILQGTKDLAKSSMLEL